MKFVSPLLKQVVYPCLSTAGYFAATSKPGLAVVTYHGILPSDYKPIDPVFDGSFITAEIFREQLRLLKKKYTVISPDEMRAWCRGAGQLPSRAVLLTCDDGLLNNLTEMLPILNEEGVRCLFFVTGESGSNQRSMLWYQKLLLIFLRAPAGKFSISAGEFEITGVLAEVSQRRRVWWDSVVRMSGLDPRGREEFLDNACAHFQVEDPLSFYRLSYPAAERHFCLMTAGEVKQLADSGMTIGAHTSTHPLLSQLAPDVAWSEMADSRTRLESMLGMPIWALAYPFGYPESVSPQIFEMAERIGFEAAFMNVGGGLGADLPRHAMPRIHVSAEMSSAELEAHVSGFYEGMKRGLRRSA